MFVTKLLFSTKIDNVLTSSIIVSPGRSEHEIEVTSLNGVMTNFKLLYETNDNIIVKYLRNTTNPNNNINDRQTLLLQITNNSSSNISVIFNIASGYIINGIDEIDTQNGYEEITTYYTNPVLTVNPNGGVWEEQNTLQKFNLYNGETKTLVNPTRAGYDFTSWTATNDGVIDGSIFTMGYEDSTVTADYIPQTYTVTFNPSSGSVNPTTSIITYDYTYGTLPTHSRENYEFIGWFTDSTNGTQVLASTIVNTTGDRTLYAR